VGAVHSLLSAQLYIYLQSGRRYISPPIAACFVFGVAGLKRAGAISSLLVGFVGRVAFVFEVLTKGSITSRARFVGSLT